MKVVLFFTTLLSGYLYADEDLGNPFACDSEPTLLIRDYSSTTYIIWAIAIILAGLIFFSKQILAKRNATMSQGSHNLTRLFGVLILVWTFLLTTFTFGLRSPCFKQDENGTIHYEENPHSGDVQPQ